MTATLILLILAVLFGFYVAWNIGANDVANAVGTSVGSGALTLKQAVLIAAVFEFAGAFFFGSNVAETIEAGVVNPDFFSGDIRNYVYGMLASLLATGVWLQLASYCGWPVSTTHAIVGAVLGFGLVQGDMSAVNWGEMGSIVISWIISPLLGGSLAYLIFTIIRKKILYSPKPIRATKYLAPYLSFCVFFVLSLIIFFGGLKNFDLELNFFEALLIAVGIGVFAGIITYILARRIDERGGGASESARKQNIEVMIGLKKAQKHLRRVEAAALGGLHDRVEELVKEVSHLSDTIEVAEVPLTPSEYHIVERIFVYLQIVTACFMAFAHGSNDVANAIGPLSAIFNILQGRDILDTSSVSLWFLFLGGFGIVCGLATWGWRVIETVGRKITELTPSRGFAAGFAASATIVLASKMGLPISTTHVIVGAVLGVGFARGIGAINLGTIRDIVISWIVTVPVGAALSALFFFTLKYLFS